MMRRIKKWLWQDRLKRYEDIAPDEIFLDSSNLPQFNTQQFEGVLERPISKRTITMLGVFFIVVGMLYLTRIGDLEVVQGQAFAERSTNNLLTQLLLFPNRGVIYDRNGTELAWNVPGTKEGDIPDRAYIQEDGFAHLLGYVKPPLRDDKGHYYQKEFIGKAGIELSFNDLLNGSNGTKLIETDAQGNVVGESEEQPPHDGENLTLSIDADVQAQLYSYIKATALDRGFASGGGVIMNVNNGDVLALTSFPEYDSAVMAQGSDAKLIHSYNTDPREPFLDRVVSGLYTPGSIVKPFVGIGALDSGVITPDKKILSTGSISVPNPYYPDKVSVFHDWRPQGWVNMQDAIAVSSDVYFYEVGGGYQDQKGLGITLIKKYMQMFGIDTSTGVDLPGESSGTIPDPAWKKKMFNGASWYLGDTYHTAIGQYGFQVTPIEMVRAVAAIANYGTLLKPELLTGRKEVEGTVNIPREHFNTIQDGMRLAAVTGTAKGLNVSYLKIAAKTGTAQVAVGGGKERDNSWVIGFFPYEKPKYAFAVVMEKGPPNNEIGGLFVMRQLFDWMHVHAPQYLTDTGQTIQTPPPTGP